MNKFTINQYDDIILNVNMVKYIVWREQDVLRIKGVHKIDAILQTLNYKEAGKARMTGGKTDYLARKRRV